MERFSVPSKDELAKINGRALNLSAALHLKSEMPTATAESVLWVGLGAIALQESLKSQSIFITDHHAVRLARFAAGNLPGNEVRDELRMIYPELKDAPNHLELRTRIDTLLAQSEIIRNPAAIAEIHGRK